MNARTIILYAAATLAVAAAVHLGTVWYLPNIIMDRAMAQMGAVNTIHHGQRATAAIHGVVRPSPDLLYSVCPYDVSKEPLRVAADVPKGTYWSVSIFDDATNNFFVLNDSQTHRTLTVVLFSPDAPDDNGVVATLSRADPAHLQRENLRLVKAPTARGLVVFRTLVNNETNFTAIDAARHKSGCTPLSEIPHF